MGPPCFPHAGFLLQAQGAGDRPHSFLTNLRHRRPSTTRARWVSEASLLQARCFHGAGHHQLHQTPCPVTQKRISCLAHLSMIEFRLEAGLFDSVGSRQHPTVVIVAAFDAAGALLRTAVPRTARWIKRAFSYHNPDRVIIPHKPYRPCS